MATGEDTLRRGELAFEVGITCGEARLNHAEFLNAITFDAQRGA
jgi:hypothetical protein